MIDTLKAYRRLICVGSVAGVMTVATVQGQTHETVPAHDRTAMMAECQSMMTAMKADQDRLDDLIAKMNTASGQLKIDQMAAVLTELVAQQKAMRVHMMHMDGAPAPKANPEKEPPQTGHEQHH